MKVNEELDLWKESSTLVKVLYSLTKSFSKEVASNNTGTLGKWTISTPQNIVEAFRNAIDEGVMCFLQISRGASHTLEKQVNI